MKLSFSKFLTGLARPLGFPGNDSFGGTASGAGETSAGGGSGTTRSLAHADAIDIPNVVHLPIVPPAVTLGEGVPLSPDGVSAT